MKIRRSRRACRGFRHKANPTLPASLPAACSLLCETVSASVPLPKWRPRRIRRNIEPQLAQQRFEKRTTVALNRQPRMRLPTAVPVYEKRAVFLDCLACHRGAVQAFTGGREQKHMMIFEPVVSND